MGAEDPDHLVRERDFRHEVDDPLAPGDHLARHLQEHVRLAGTGDAEEVDRSRRPSPTIAADGVALLLGKLVARAASSSSGSSSVSVSRLPPGIIAESASPREHMYIRDIHRASCSTRSSNSGRASMTRPISRISATPSGGGVALRHDQAGELSRAEGRRDPEARPRRRCLGQRVGEDSCGRED